MKTGTKTHTKTRKTAAPPKAEREAMLRDALAVLRTATDVNKKADAVIIIARLGPNDERKAKLLEKFAAATALAEGGVDTSLLDDRFFRDVLDTYDSTLENSGISADNPPDMDGLNSYLKSLGVPQSRQPELAAKIDAFAKAEITGREAAPAAPQLSAADLAAFMEHAAAHQWNPESKPKVAPSAFIAATFKNWLGRGLGLEHVRKAQKNLATAYSAEVHREPSNRIAKLQTRPHTRHSKEPPALETTKVTRSGWIPTSELSDEQTALRRKNQAASKREARQAAQATLT